MPPPPINRFPSGPSPYHQQFSTHGQHTASHPPQLTGNPAYLNQNAQVNPFSANSNLLGLGGGLNAGGGGFNVGGDSGLASHAARMGFQHGAQLQQQQQSQQQQHQQQQAQQQTAQHSQHAQHAQHQQHMQHAPQQGHGALADHVTRSQSKSRIREVWRHNLHEEMAILRDLVDKYPYIAMVGLQSPLYWDRRARKWLTWVGSLSRTPSFPALCRDRWEVLGERVITITNVSGPTSTC